MFVPIAIFISSPRYRINDPAQRSNRMATWQESQILQIQHIKDKIIQNDNLRDGETALPKLAKIIAPSA